MEERLHVQRRRAVPRDAEVRGHRHRALVWDPASHDRGRGAFDELGDRHRGTDDRVRDLWPAAVADARSNAGISTVIQNAHIDLYDRLR